MGVQTHARTEQIDTLVIELLLKHTPHFYSRAIVYVRVPVCLWTKAG